MLISVSFGAIDFSEFWCHFDAFWGHFITFVLISVGFGGHFGVLGPFCPFCADFHGVFGANLVLLGPFLWGFGAILVHFVLMSVGF